MLRRITPRHGAFPPPAQAFGLLRDQSWLVIMSRAAAALGLFGRQPSRSGDSCVRELTNVAVERCVFHLVAPNAEKLTLSEAIPSLTAHQAEFLASHVVGGLKDPQATAARFIVNGPERVQGLSETLQSEQADLVLASQKMAQLLFEGRPAGKGWDVCCYQMFG